MEEPTSVNAGEIAILSTRLDGLTREVRDGFKRLFGNGQRGLLAEHHALLVKLERDQSARIADLDRDHDERIAALELEREERGARENTLDLLAKKSADRQTFWLKIIGLLLVVGQVTTTLLTIYRK